MRSDVYAVRRAFRNLCNPCNNHHAVADARSAQPAKRARRRKRCRTLSDCCSSTRATTFSY
eukprot:4405177-Lingulodinium_polyedra.AAC.1